MKFIKKTVVTAILFAVLCTCTVSAKNNVSQIDIDVTVKNDGSAYIVQKWRGEFDEGTENYIPISEDDISVSDFTVSDKNGIYSFVNDWNIDASLEEKAEKCGINKTSDGVELCFGISEYGKNEYIVSYVVEDFIKGYDECDGTNFMFVNPEMSTFPTNGHISITLENKTALNEENCAIWAFGYDGIVEFSNGDVVAQTNAKLSGDDCMIVMMSLDKGLISPKKQTGMLFEHVKEKAFEGSDYGEDYDDDEAGMLETIVGFAVLLAIFALVVAVIVFVAKRKKELKKLYAEAEYFRDVPNNGRINVSHYLAQNFDVSGEESLIIGALILSMINKGTLEPQIENSIGTFGKEKESVNIKLIKAPDAAPELDLYSLLSAAAGNDGILQEKELEKYAYKHPKKIIDFVDGVMKSGEKEFVSDGGFLSGTGNRVKDLSAKGKTELCEIMGLKKYLEDFTLIAEREITETEIWKEYMIYATLFGISEKVIKQMKKLYPDKIPEIESYSKNAVIASSYYRSMYMSSQRAIQAQRTSGGGGRASFGGGGGFSGGGHGGGSR